MRRSLDIAFAVLAALIVILFAGCGASEDLATIAPVGSLQGDTPTTPPTTEPEVHVAALPERGASFQVGTTTPPPFDPVAYVNGLPYGYGIPGPALEAYRIVAAAAGWDANKIVAWEPFVNDVIRGESVYCWNLVGGDLVHAGTCTIYRHGSGEDTGFGQATSSLWGRNAQLCQLYGICSQAQILASPWESMLWSVIRPIELNGSQPWCYSAWARDYHDCWLAPDR